MAVQIKFGARSGDEDLLLFRVQLKIFYILTIVISLGDLTPNVVVISIRKILIFINLGLSIIMDHVLNWTQI